MTKLEKKSKADLKKMHTGSLLSRRKALLKCEESFELSDQIRRSTDKEIEFKNTKEWLQAYSDLKEELSKREHVPNSRERTTLRQQKSIDKPKSKRQ